MMISTFRSFLTFFLVYLVASPVSFSADVSDLRSILRNIISASGKKLSVSITVDEEEASGWASIKIIKSGKKGHIYVDPGHLRDSRHVWAVIIGHEVGHLLNPREGKIPQIMSERYADNLGAQLAHKAGYNVHEFIRYVKYNPHCDTDHGCWSDRARLLELTFGGADDKPPPDRTRSVAFKNMKIQHNQLVVGANGRFTRGMRIFLDMEARNLKLVNCTAVAYFFFGNGKRLQDFNGYCKASDGQVCQSLAFRPQYHVTELTRAIISIPYDELHLARGSHDLKVHFQAFTSSGRVVGTSNWMHFNVTQN